MIHRADGLDKAYEDLRSARILIGHSSPILCYDESDMQPFKNAGSWSHAVEHWSRLAEANRKATTKWLQALPLEESLRIFEDLAEGIPELDFERTSTDHPIPLFKIWRP